MFYLKNTSTATQLKIKIFLMIKNRTEIKYLAAYTEPIHITLSSKLIGLQCAIHVLLLVRKAYTLFQKLLAG